MTPHSATHAVPNLGPWLTADDAQTYLGFPSRKALYQAVRRGQVPVHRIGRRLRFSQIELDVAVGKRKTLDVIGESF